MKYLGIDYGTRRIGVALSDENGAMAFPVAVFLNDGSALRQIADLIQKEKVSCVVMGESKNLSGSANIVHEESVRFLNFLKEKADVTIFFEPEFYTSYEASRGGSSDALLDASAATLILNSYLKRIHSA